MRRHRSCQAPHSHPKSSARPIERVPELARFLQHFFDLGVTRSEELSEIPFSVTLVRIGQDAPERIELGEVVPVPLQAVQRHRVTRSHRRLAALALVQRRTRHRDMARRARRYTSRVDSRRPPS